MNIIHESDGLAFLAHTYVYSDNISENLRDIVSEHKFDGLERHYAAFTHKQTEYIMNFCSDHNLFCSGGSDFHGASVKPNDFMSLGSGKEIIDYSHIQPWINKVKNIL